MQPNHKTCESVLRCILFFLVVALIGVYANEPKEFLGSGEMHPVFSCGLIWRECSRTIGIPRALQGLLFIAALVGVNGAKTTDFLGFADMHVVFRFWPGLA